MDVDGSLNKGYRPGDADKSPWERKKNLMNVRELQQFEARVVRFPAGEPGLV